MHKPEKIRDELDRGAVSMRAHMKHLIADHIEHWLMGVEGSLASRSKNPQSPFTSAINGIGDRRLEIIDATARSIG